LAVSTASLRLGARPAGQQQRADVQRDGIRLDGAPLPWSSAFRRAGILFRGAAF
jgi:hypothetical protein